jgi:Leucine-rich repeat (LRR) protein
VKDDDNQTLVLAASGVNLGGSLHADLRNFTRLQNLTFAGCNLSGTMVRLPPALVTFDIRNNNVNGTVAKSLFANRSLPLQRFVVANNDFAEIDFAAFDNAPNLTFLQLANSLAASQATRLHALPSESFLTSHRQLQALQLDGINFGTALPSLAPLNLTLLTARNCNFSGTVPSQIGRMTKLTGLFLNGNPITRLPSALSLTSLDLTGTSLNVSELLPFAAKLTALTFCRLPQPQVPCISSNNNKCSASNSTDCRPATTTATTVAALSTAVTTAAATPATTTSTATLSTTTTMSALSGPESLASAASDLTIPIAIGAGIAAVVLISAVVISIVVWRKK